KIDADGLPTARIGTSKDLKVGEWVLAIGSPFGFDYTVTAGIISALGRSLPSENYVPFIQTDVAINPGNSGGPLFNLKGEVIGINSQIYSRTGGFMGLSFAIPIDVAMDAVNQLRDKGRVSRGWLGVLIQDVDRDLAESFGMSKPSGALVAQVLDGGPAARAGVEVGDVILEFDGTPVTNSAALPPIVGRTEVGKAVQVKVLRRGREEVLSIAIGELPEEGTQAGASGQPIGVESARLGLAVSDLSKDRREATGIGQGGVVVTEVKGGPAARAGLQRGDVIVLFDNAEIEGAVHFRQLLRDLPEERKTVAILVHRDGGPLFVPLRLKD
ncbi:MAG: PDZ domain-containing protein, partial [Gammaproteobacteria bacterium]